MTIKNSKGFTIIELLVVVAIIAVLAAIVLVNVTSYINKGKNASIKGNLATVLTNSAVHYDTAGSYDNFCTNAYFTGPSAAITAAGGAAICVESTDNAEVCACSSLVGTTNVYCVDSTGLKKEYTDASACSANCPSVLGGGKCK